MAQNINHIRSNKKGAGQMVKQISLFNHKGGVSKTTTTFNLGWMLANKGEEGYHRRLRPPV